MKRDEERCVAFRIDRPQVRRGLFAPGFVLGAVHDARSIVALFTERLPALAAALLDAASSVPEFRREKLLWSRAKGLLVVPA